MLPSLGRLLAKVWANRFIASYYGQDMKNEKDACPALPGLLLQTASSAVLQLGSTEPAMQVKLGVRETGTCRLLMIHEVLTASTLAVPGRNERCGSGRTPRSIPPGANLAGRQDIILPLRITDAAWPNIRGSFGHLDGTRHNLLPGGGHIEAYP